MKLVRKLLVYFWYEKGFFEYSSKNNYVIQYHINIVKINT